MLAVILKEGTEFSPGRGRGFLGGGLRKFCASTEGAPKMLPLPQGGHRKLWASVNKDPHSQDVNCHFPNLGSPVNPNPFSPACIDPVG